MNPSLVFHGGDCCGIKHIYNLSFGPDMETGALEEWNPKTDLNISHRYDEKDYGEAEEEWDDITDGCATLGMRWYFPKRKRETLGQRVKAYVKWADEQREGQVIEIVLGLGDEFNQKAWVPFIEKLGFKLVTLFENSNSGNTVGIFHRVTGEIPLTECPRPSEKKTKPAPFAR